MVQAPAAGPLRIGEVARRSGASVKTIRFYADQGLLVPIGRSQGGYRLFEATVFSELSLIRTLRALEIPLVTIAAFLEARRSGLCSCDRLQAQLRSKAEEIEQRIADLQSLKAELTGMLAGWQSCGGRRPEALI